MRISRRTWIIVAVLIALAAYPAYYLISPFFIVTHVNEPPPASSLTPTSRGNFQNGAPGHTASGIALLYLRESGNYFVRFENFAVTNGPDLNVYLSKSQSPSQGFIDLGNLKGSSGDQNYDVPQNVDPQQYPYVLVWCVTFSVLFGYSVLS